EGTCEEGCGQEGTCEEGCGQEGTCEEGCGQEGAREEGRGEEARDPEDVIQEVSCEKDVGACAIVGEAGCPAGDRVAGHHAGGDDVRGLAAAGSRACSGG